MQREKPPLYLMEIGIIGRSVRPREKLKAAIEKMGGKLVTKIHENLACIISTPKEIERMTARMETAQNFGIQIVAENFVDDIMNGGTIEYIKANCLSEWGADVSFFFFFFKRKGVNHNVIIFRQPEKRIVQDEPGVSTSRSIYTMAKPKSVTLKIVDGAAVDPSSGLQDFAHVYTDGTLKFFAVLSYTDIQENKNSYYKIQLLEGNKNNS